jgi:signal transduction histidine kinase
MRWPPLPAGPRLPLRRPGLWRRIAWVDAAWVALCVANIVAILVFSDLEDVPFLLIWISLTLLYGLRVWPAKRGNARLLATQRRFLQDASHQLRTPITIALGHAELLASELTGRSEARDIQVVVGELTRLRRLSERLLMIAASEDPDFLRPEPVALDRFTLEVFRKWTPTAERRWALGRLDPVMVDADRERLGLTVDALLENAVRHTARGDSIRLSVLRGRDGECARMIVADGGEGILPAELDRIFERFRTGSQLGGTRGTGLGLALVRAVARAHGGDVRVRSTPGEGSEFELVLPLLAPPAGAPAVPGEEMLAKVEEL